MRFIGVACEEQRLRWLPTFTEIHQTIRFVGRCCRSCFFPNERFYILKFQDLLVHQSVVYGSKRGNNSRLCAENQTTQRRFLKTSALRRGEFGFSPAAFRTDSKRGALLCLNAEDSSDRWRIWTLGQNQPNTIFAARERSFRTCQAGQNRQADTARLLRSLQEDFSPAVSTLGRCGEQGLFASFRGKRHNCGYSQFGGFFYGPFESIKFHHSQ